MLVHGAGTGGWLWDLEAEILRQRGHSVTAPTLSGVGDRLAEGGPETSLSTHIDDVIGCLPDHAAAGLVLVGFSYGGLVAAGVVDRIPERVAMLAYLDAFVPVPGRLMFDLMPASMRASLQGAALSSGGGWQMPPIPLERLGPLGAIGAGVDLSRLPKLLARRGPHPIGTYEEPAGPRNPAPHRCRRSTSHVGRTAITTPWRRSQPRAAGIPIYVLRTGHFPMLTMPVELADLLESLLPV
jgi:pimeloyl-ACP methyl ester carboxylesterase